MNITSNRHHDKHKIVIVINNITHAHWAQLRCADCDKHIQWLNKKGVEELYDILYQMDNEYVVTSEKFEEWKNNPQRTLLLLKHQPDSIWGSDLDSYEDYLIWNAPRTHKPTMTFDEFVKHRHLEDKAVFEQQIEDSFNDLFAHHY